MMSLQNSARYFTTLFFCLVALNADSAFSLFLKENQKLNSGNNLIQEQREPLSLGQKMAEMGGGEDLGEEEEENPIFSDHRLQAEKRRIGLTMPNILHAYAGQEADRGLFDPMFMQKRRIGLRLPNIIYMRDLDKRKASEWPSYNY